MSKETGRKSRWGGCFLLLACLIFGSVYGWAEEKSQVQLVSVSPMGGSYVSNTPEFTLTFDKNVAAAEVREQNRALVAFYDQSGTEILSHVEIVDDEIYPLQKREIGLKVLETLPAGSYKLVVAAGVRAKNGTSTGKSYVYYYRVRAEEIPEESEEEPSDETESSQEADPTETEASQEAVSESEESESTESSNGQMQSGVDPSDEDFPNEPSKGNSEGSQMEPSKEYPDGSQAEPSKENPDGSQVEASKKNSDGSQTEAGKTGKVAERDKPSDHPANAKENRLKEKKKQESKELQLFRLVLTEQASDNHLDNGAVAEEDVSWLADYGQELVKMTVLGMIGLFCLGLAYRVLRFKRELARGSDTGSRRKRRRK